MIRWLRSNLRSVYPLRDTYQFSLAALDRMRASKARLLASLHEDFQRTDPWEYTESPIQCERFQSALRLLDLVCEGRLFESALEVGCAEGVFTAMLTPRCKSLLSVDIIDVALARAATRCVGLGVAFRNWDLVTSPVPIHPQLLVVMDVLELYVRPVHVRSAREKLVQALQPGGFLLFGGSRQNPFFETSWWGKYMLRGGRRVAEFLGEHPDLELIATETGEIYVNAIFRKRMENSN